MRLSKALLAGLVVAGLGVATFTGTAAPSATAADLAWMDTNLAPQERATLLVDAMTPDQKFQQIAMKPIENPEICPYYSTGRHVEGIPELSIPTLRMTNGPGGGGGDCAPQDMEQTSVASELSVAASWDDDVAARQGTLAGEEAIANAHNIFLGVGINLGRVPNLGRNYEYYGEDPYLTGRISSEKVKALQAEGVQANAKHFIANEQETNRRTANSIIDEKTLHELYLLPFEMNIKDADLSAVMCSYNRIGGAYACENQETLGTILRDQLGFEGYVMSDRGATLSTAPSIKGGLDLEFASPKWYTPQLVQAAIDAGEVTWGDIDTMLLRRYTVMFKLGQFENPLTSRTTPDLAANGIEARKLAEEGMVLLKNDADLLPLDGTGLVSVALIGPKTFAGQAKLPSGPGFVMPEGILTPQQGLQQALQDMASVGTVTYNDGRDIAAAAELAAQSEVVIMMVGDNSVEGSDRANLSLPTIDGVNQEALISAVAAANDKTIVVLKNGGPVLTPWRDEVPAVLEAWYSGQEDALAVANVLFGNTNPGGKLPMTFPGDPSQGAMQTAEQFPGVNIDGVPTVTYSEKLEIGYRWYDAHEVTPAFPFGYGLSYTDFELSNVSVTPTVNDGTQPITVSVDVTNTGRVAGAEVPQVYLGIPGEGQPPKRLVGFEKVSLQAGETRTVEMTIDPASSNHPLSVWDVDSDTWVAPDGRYPVYVGTSAANATVAETITVSAAPVVDVPVVVTPRAVAGKAYVTVTATNNEDVPVAITLSTPYGDKAWAAVAPGKSASVSFNSRLAEIPAGEATAVIEAVIDGETVSTTTTVPFGAFPG